jgi:hypothetical protein
MQVIELSEPEELRINGRVPIPMRPDKTSGQNSKLTCQFNIIYIMRSGVVIAK